jgi:hypothetical protein
MRWGADELAAVAAVVANLVVVDFAVHRVGQLDLVALFADHHSVRFCSDSLSHRQPQIANHLLAMTYRASSRTANLDRGGRYSI